MNRKHLIFSWVGIGCTSKYVGNRLQETQPKQILRKHPISRRFGRRLLWLVAVLVGRCPQRSLFLAAVRALVWLVDVFGRRLLWLIVDLVGRCHCFWSLAVVNGRCHGCLAAVNGRCHDCSLLWLVYFPVNTAVLCNGRCHVGSLVWWGCVAISQIMLGWNAYKYYHETDELSTSRLTQPKKKLVRYGVLGHYFPRQIIFP